MLIPHPVSSEVEELFRITFLGVLTASIVSAVGMLYPRTESSSTPALIGVQSRERVFTLSTKAGSPV